MWKGWSKELLDSNKIFRMWCTGEKTLIVRKPFYSTTFYIVLDNSPHENTPDHLWM